MSRRLTCLVFYFVLNSNGFVFASGAGKGSLVVYGKRFVAGPQRAASSGRFVLSTPGPFEQKFQQLDALENLVAKTGRKNDNFRSVTVTCMANMGQEIAGLSRENVALKGEIDRLVKRSEDLEETMCFVLERLERVTNVCRDLHRSERQRKELERQPSSRGVRLGAIREANKK